MNVMRPIEDIIDVSVLQKIQDNVANAVGMSFVTVDYKGTPITKESGFTRFCSEGRKIPEMMALCYQCDAHGGLHAAITGKPYTYRCHAGLTDFAVPLLLNGTYYGAVLGGQVLTSEDDAHCLNHVMEERFCWQEVPDLVEARKEFKYISNEKLYAVMALLAETVKCFLEKGELDQKNREMLDEKAALLELEKTVEEKSRNMLFNHIKPGFLFNNLSIITRLSYLENARKTGEAVYALSDMLRYAFEKGGERLSSLGDELEYAEKYLKVQQIRLEDKLHFEIQVLEKYYDVACPFMTVQSILENAIEYIVDPAKESHRIRIDADCRGDDVIISIFTSGGSFPQELIDNIEERNVRLLEEDKYDLCSISRKLCIFFGRKYKLAVENLEKEEGTTIFLRLPKEHSFRE